METPHEHRKEAVRLCSARFPRSSPRITSTSDCSASETSRMSGSYKSITIHHSSGAPDKRLENIRPAMSSIEDMSRSGTKTI